MHRITDRKTDNRAADDGDPDFPNSSPETHATHIATASIIDSNVITGSKAMGKLVM